MAGHNRALKLLGAAVVVGLVGWAVVGKSGPLVWAADGFNRVINPLEAVVLAARQPEPSVGQPLGAAANQGVTASNAVTASGPSRFAGQEASLGLTRPLSGDQKVIYGGRDRTVLGTKQTGTPPATPQTVLLVRDEESGQIDYWQPGLRVELKPGNDYTAFIAEHAGLTRRFANSQYADVGVDAADIAKVHADLTADPRVARVEFLPVRVPPKAK